MTAPLGSGREFDLIRALLERWGAHAVGIGDDAAVLALPRGDALVASVDAFVEHRHFRRGWLSSREIGYRAVTAALSDLAAMASRPVGVLLALAVPTAWEGELPAIADGVGEAVETARVPIVGGNMTAASELSITTTVLGAAFDVLRRDALRVGDLVYVTGRLGGPGAAISAFLRGAVPSAIERERFVHPVARLHEARWLAEHGATAAIDISDGFAADAGHLAAASDVRLEIDLDLLPRLPGVEPLAAAESGEEYELVVGAPRELDVAAFERRFDLPLTRVGRAVAPGAGVVLLSAGQRVARARGHDHFSR